MAREGTVREVYRGGGKIQASKTSKLQSLNQPAISPTLMEENSYPNRALPVLPWYEV